MRNHPRLLLTMGDVAGIGPEIIARAWPQLHTYSQPVVVGDANWLRQALKLTNTSAELQVVENIAEANPTPSSIPLVQGTTLDLTRIEPGKVNGTAGRAAYEFLCIAVDEVMARRADGIVTAPLHKEGLREGAIKQPGHTEILADRTATKSFAMMLYAQCKKIPHGLGVAHVTLHMAIRDILRHVSAAGILDTIRLLDRALPKLCGRKPRIGVAALNPHSSDGGLFGDEEARMIEPAVKAATSEEIDASGPWPSDTLFVRAARGEFDGIVAMYHDQGHIPMKLLGGMHAVNVSLGLPLVRTSVAHGTAYDIAGKGLADPTSLIEAVRVASRLAIA